MFFLFDLSLCGMRYSVGEVGFKLCFLFFIVFFIVILIIRVAVFVKLGEFLIVMSVFIITVFLFIV